MKRAAAKAKKKTASKTAAHTAAGGKPARATAPTARRPAAKKAVRKAAAAKKPVARKAVAKKKVAKKIAVKKLPAKKSAAKKAPATTLRRPIAKPAKKVASRRPVAKREPVLAVPRKGAAAPRESVSSGPVSPEVALEHFRKLLREKQERVQQGPGYPAANAYTGRHDAAGTLTPTAPQPQAPAASPTLDPEALPAANNMHGRGNQGMRNQK